MTINSVGASLFAGMDPRLYFGNAGVSANGSLVVLSQDPRSATAESVFIVGTSGVFVQPSPT